jgi:tight adherence protein C
MTPVSIAISCGVFGVVFSVGWLLIHWLDPYHAQLDARLREIPKDPGLKSRWRKRRKSPSEQGVARQAVSVSTTLSRLFADGGEDRQGSQLQLLHAGIYSPSALSTFFAVKLMLIVLPPLAGLSAGWTGILDLRLGLLWGAIGGALGMVLPSFWLNRKIRNRHCILRHALADFLDLMIVCLESGLSLQGTLQRVTDELKIAHPLLAGELNIVQRDIELGATIEASLRRFADRSGYEGIRALGSFIRESQRFGTELSEALRLHADTLRSQREQAAEETAQKASVKILLPTMLLILPAVFVVLAGPAAIQIQEAFAKK